MDTNLTLPQLKTLVATYQGYDLAMIRAIIATESSGIGFSRLAPYRIIIRFEPTWFKREFANWQAEKQDWMNTGVQNQTDEWKAFDAAFAVDPKAAMLSTSIGMAQIMGFHYSDLGFKSVDEFWDFCKQSEINQIDCMLRFIRGNPSLDKAVRNLDYSSFAYYYNGAYYKELAAKSGDLPYDVRIAANRKKFLALQATGN